MSDKSESKPREPIWIECAVDCDGDEDGWSFDLQVTNIEGHDQGQEWDNSMKIEFIEYSAYESLQSQLESAENLAQMKLEQTETQYQRALATMRTQLAEAQAENLKLKKEVAFRTKTGSLFSEVMNGQVAVVLNREEEIATLKAEVEKLKHTLDMTIPALNSECERTRNLESQNKTLREGLVHAQQLIEEIEPEERTITENEISAHVSGTLIALAQADAVKEGGT